MTLEIYELADLADILGIGKSRLKNWTTGRPFNLRASVRTSFGKGSRNLFSRENVYCFMLVKQLGELGVPVLATQKLMEKQPSLDTEVFWKDHDWLMVSRKDRSFSWEVNLDTECILNIRLAPEDNMACFYAVNLKSLVESVDTTIDQLKGNRMRASVSSGSGNGKGKRSKIIGKKPKR